MMEKCPQCKAGMEKIVYEVGYGISVEALHCKRCGFNITDDKNLKTTVQELRRQMRKEVKVIQIGTGLGIRFPNELVKSYRIKKGKDLVIKPESDGIKLSLES